MSASILVRTWFVDPRNGETCEAPPRVQHGTRYYCERDLRERYPEARRIPGGVSIDVTPPGPWGTVREDIVIVDPQS